ncbi:cyclin-like protein [Mycena floridula]|nr:cyclin-like protein [Mycena floridula]
MATDFWASSHYKRWIPTRATLTHARADDLPYVDGKAEDLEFLAIWFGNAITKLCKKLSLRQRVIATATVFFHRFYLNNAYCETEPFTVIGACVYLAAKAEEAPVALKNVVAEARTLFGRDHPFPADTAKLAEMEFYLLDDLKCDLVIFHPYRSLLALCASTTASSTSSPEAEAGELGQGIEEDESWVSGKLALSEGALQTAWFVPVLLARLWEFILFIRFVINDTYRSPSLCLLYPPHLIAITAIYMTLVLHAPTRASWSAAVSSPELETPSAPRRSSRNSSASDQAKQHVEDPLTFLASLNVSLPLISTIAQEIIKLYALWARYKEDVGPEGGSPAKTPKTTGSTPSNKTNGDDDDVVTPAYLSALLLRMRESRVADVSQRSGPAINRLLEKTLASG